MSILSVDREKCKKDGFCAAACPMYIIKMGENEYPLLIDKEENLCINCGHCLAVCPHQALFLKTMNAEDCAPVQKELFPEPDSIRHFLQSRRSIRLYKNQALRREVLAKLIDTARYAPSGHNMQPVNWFVIENKEEVRRLSAIVIAYMQYMLKENPVFALSSHFDRVVDNWEKGIDQVCRSAPHVVVAHAPKDLSIAHSACIIALTYFELAAFSMGLGACWAGFFNLAASTFPPMIKALELPEGHQAYGSMMVGYPKYPNLYRRIPLRNKPQITWR